MAIALLDVAAQDQIGVAKTIETELLAAIARINTQAENESLVIAARAEDETLAGGVVGETSYGWLLVKLLWVAEPYRGNGLARKLLTAAEQKAQKFACHNAWLETSNAQAREIYLHLGYTEFGILENASDQPPQDHRRWFMRKTLAAE